MKIEELISWVLLPVTGTRVLIMLFWALFVADLAAARLDVSYHGVAPYAALVVEYQVRGEAGALIHSASWNATPGNDHHLTVSDGGTVSHDLGPLARSIDIRAVRRYRSDTGQWQNAGVPQLNITLKENSVVHLNASAIHGESIQVWDGDTSVTSMLAALFAPIGFYHGLLAGLVFGAPFLIASFLRNVFSERDE